MKFPFVKDKYYTCITKSEGDRGMEFLDLYRCSVVTDPDKFDKNLQKDDSHVKFINKNGVEVSYFGSIATSVFSDNEIRIQEAINFYINYYSHQINDTYSELIIYSKTILKKIDDYNHYKIHLECLSKKMGFPIFDFTKLGQELELLLNHYETNKLTPLQEFKLTSQYLELSKKHKDDVLVWKTSEGVFECTLDTLVETLNKDKFYSGTISELKVTKI